MNTEIIRSGRIGFYKETGYGFIYENLPEGQKLVSWFFHIRACSFEPKVGLQVQFRIAPGPRGPMAVEVEIVTPSIVDVLNRAKLTNGGAQ
jgi:cold shock CspA family protein